MTRISQAQARHRRVFAALSVVTVIGLVVILWPKSSNGRIVDPTSTGAPSSIATAPPTSGAPTDAVQAWLAWVPGGFPATFRRQIASADGISQDVVVAGDTLWMTESHD